jgi:3D (Asp-Asp-Asp) domain-containing protein
MSLLLGLLLVTGFTEVGPTASGVMSGPGVAACPPDIRFGTQLAIEDVGVVTCLDSYAPYLSRRIDVWQPTVADCYAITGLHSVAVVNPSDN